MSSGIFNILTTPLHTSNSLHSFYVPILTKSFLLKKKSHLLYFVEEYYDVGLFIILLHNDGMHNFFSKGPN